jgi:hypothetical protein
VLRGEDEASSAVHMSLENLGQLLPMELGERRVVEDLTIERDEFTFLISFSGMTGEARQLRVLREDLSHAIAGIQASFESAKPPRPPVNRKV